jgi:Tfp pilus assembly protein PilF
VPSDVARLLAQVHDEADPARAAAALVAYRGTPHALLAVALGNARLRQADLVTGAPRVALAGDARTAFNEALRLDPQLAAARLGLAYAAARAEDWPAAVTACAAAIAPGEAAVADLALYIDCAARAGDSRLAANLVAQAIVRHPAEGVFRRQELALLIAAERWEEAGAAVAAVLATDPADAAAWRSSAGIAARSRDADASRIGLEAALLLQPQDGDLRRQLATAQLAAGQAPAALATIRPVMNGSGPYASELVELAARAAYDADQSEQARTWLALPTTTPLGRGARLLQARLALQHGDLPAAQQALEVLLSAGELDPAVLTWAGSLAERAGDAPRAESLYRQAHAVAIGPATLRLALLLRQRHRDDEARTILAQYRQARPNDPDLPALEAALKAR